VLPTSSKNAKKTSGELHVVKRVEKCIEVDGGIFEHLL
jgi:hypothetical protein